MSVTQPPLFGPDLGPFQQHSDTSRRAAIDNYPRSGTQRAKVLIAIAASGDDGLTDHEVVERLRISPSSERPRRVELLDAGLVAASGAERSTDTGSMATVWVATDVGRAFARVLQ